MFMPHPVIPGRNDGLARNDNGGNIVPAAPPFPTDFRDRGDQPP
jgi:hypothetical protein